MHTPQATPSGDYDGKVRGHSALGFAAVGSELARLASGDAGYSAQFCAYVDGRPVVDIWAGPDVDGRDLLGVFSATKGAAAVCIALLVDRGVLDLDAAVCSYWPEFARGGKEHVTVRVALSHQAGLVGVEPQLTLDELLDHELLAGRLAEQIPHWRPGSAHGYHALTFGTLMDELVRRVDGRSVADFFREEIAEPRDIDVHIATTPAVEDRVRDLFPQQPTPEEAAELKALPPPWADSSSLAGMAFNSTHLDILSPPMPNVPAVRAAGFASAGGVASASGLARLYANCISSVDGHPRLLTPEVVSAVTQVQAAGQDLVLGTTMRFGVGFMRPHPDLPFGSHQAFGHDGAGGAIGGADPRFGLAYAYISRRMYFPGGADPRGFRLAEITRQCASTTT